MLLTDGQTNRLRQIPTCLDGGNFPQTYLQRPTSWGRATAGRQDVVSHVHTAKRKVYSLHSSSRQM